MTFLSCPTPEEIGVEIREAVKRIPPRAPGELFTELVRKGWINARGQVTTFLGGVAEPEPNYETWTDDEPVVAQKPKSKAKKSKK